MDLRTDLVDSRRVWPQDGRKPGSGAVVYWMSRDQRVSGNWALLFAIQLAMHKKVPLAVVFVLVPSFLQAAERQYRFMLKGLQEVESSLAERGIPFFLLQGQPPEKLLEFMAEYQIGTLVSDFDPLRIKRRWKQSLRERSDVPIFTVDAHNIVPAFQASNKQEFAAYTLRPKLKKLLPEFLHPFPAIPEMPAPAGFAMQPVDWSQVEKRLSPDPGVPEVDWIQAGAHAARTSMNDFLSHRLGHYATGRNDPNQDAISHLSPYLHFGQLSAQTLALEVLAGDQDEENKESFLEELIVRKELSDNFCLFNPHYDAWEGLPAWARKTLKEHWRDEREYLYTKEDLEPANTHDELWNASQREMRISGKMHGYMRMYWAKKILEWTRDPATALEICIYLNDKYELDGRDPNGYAGCAWSVGGLHDRAWGERPVFGKIRYMSEKGCRRKFDVDAYIRKWNPSEESLSNL